MAMGLAKCVAEAIATFALVIVGAGSIIADSQTDGAVGIVGVALAHGLVLLGGISATMHISGAHINPAVTVAMMAVKRITPSLAVAYIGAQLIGATAAGVVLKMTFQPEAAVKVNLGTPALGAGIGFSQGILIEAILTFLLLFVIFGTAVDPRAPKGIYGFAIGLTVAAEILVGGPLTGASMNPARTLGPALVAGFWDGHLVYWIGPILGAVISAFLYEHLLLPPHNPS
jgi:MIP family channel proteins